MDWTKIKIPKNESLRVKKIDNKSGNITFIITENKTNKKPFTLYQVNPDHSIVKLRSDVSPMFKETI